MLRVHALTQCPAVEIPLICSRDRVHHMCIFALFCVLFGSYIKKAICAAQGGAGKFKLAHMALGTRDYVCRSIKKNLYSQKFQTLEERIKIACL